MAPPVNKVCTDCNVLKTVDNSCLRRIAADGVTQVFRSQCRKCECARRITAERENHKMREWKRARRRAKGTPLRGEKPLCKNGHERTPENRRSGRYDCKVCHRDEQRARTRAAGAAPRMPRTVCTAGHPLIEGNVRRGRHAGDCLLCHRLREKRDYDADARAYVEVLLRDPCSYCGGPGGSIDHIVPVAAGGSDDWSNLTSACQSCNASKKTASLLHFMLRRASGQRPDPRRRKRVA